MVYPSQNEVFGILDVTGNGPVLGCPGQEGSDRINGEWIKGLVITYLKMGDILGL